MKKTHLILGLVTLFVMISCGSSKIVKTDPYVGSWSMLIEGTPQGDVSATLAILKDDTGVYSGSLSSDLGTFKLSNFSITDNKLSGGFVVQEMDFDLTGTFEDTLFKGFVSGMGADFKANGKKIIAE